MLESLVRRGTVHTSSPCGRFVGHEAAEHWFGRFCRERTNRIGGFLHFISVFPSQRHVLCNEPCVDSVSCHWCLQGPGLHSMCGEAIAFRLGHTGSMCGAVLHGGWLCPTSALVVSTVTGCLLMMRKSVPHVLFHCPSTAGLLCIQVSTCLYDHLPGT